MSVLRLTRFGSDPAIQCDNCGHVQLVAENMLEYTQRYFGKEKPKETFKMPVRDYFVECDLKSHYGRMNGFRYYLESNKDLPSGITASSALRYLDHRERKAMTLQQAYDNN